jgi:D-alanyl-D-alanine carboxypeptidase
MDVKKFIGWCIKGMRMKLRKMPKEHKRLVIYTIIVLLIGGMFGGSIGRSKEEKRSEKKVAQAVAKVQEKDDKKLKEVEKQLYDLKEQVNGEEVKLPWNMVLVNGDHPMEEGYVPQLKELEEGLSLDSRIIDAAKEMLADAKKAGLHIDICSAYRSVERQEQVFGDSMKERVKDGMSYWDAFNETALNVAIPGTSEHALGLALDLISNQYTELDERQETTAEAKWLKENCHKYGFILRYPPEKTNITGIIYEPWHYRYVGVEDATEIMKLGITLEEYLQDYYQPAEGQ